jgi:microcystin degradation protein MlrC
MRELVDLASLEERAEGLVDVTLFGGFAYADTPHTHATVAITHDTAFDPAPVAARLADAFVARRDAFGIGLPDARAALNDAIRALDAGAAWPIAIVDPADNPLSGGIGDTTEQFRVLTKLAPSYPTVFCFFYDPALVARAHGLGVGAEISCQLGGRITEYYGAPVPFEGVVQRLTDGRFRNRGPMERGREINLGRTAVLRSGEMQVVISETCQSANDPAWCDLHGIDLSKVALFCVKAKNHFRAGFEEHCAKIVDIDCPGPAPVDLTRLPYRHVPDQYLRQGRSSGTANLAG